MFMFGIVTSGCQSFLDLFNRSDQNSRVWLGATHSVLEATRITPRRFGSAVIGGPAQCHGFIIVMIMIRNREDA